MHFKWNTSILKTFLPIVVPRQDQTLLIQQQHSRPANKHFSVLLNILVELRPDSHFFQMNATFAFYKMQYATSKKAYYYINMMKLPYFDMEVKFVV